MRFESDIVVATEVRDGWVFATSSGDVARSDTFLGALRSLGRVNGPVHASPTTSGRATIIGRGGDLWTTTGRGLSVRSELPTSARYAVFADELRGAALLTDLRVAVTTNGGLTWAVPSLVGEFARGVYVGASGVTVQTTGGHLVLEADGGLHHRPDAGRPAASPTVDRAVVRRLNAEAARVTAVYSSPPGATSEGAPRGWPDEPFATWAGMMTTGHYRCRYAGETAAATRPQWEVAAERALQRIRDQDVNHAAIGWSIQTATPRGALLEREGVVVPRLGWMDVRGTIVSIPEPSLDEGGDLRQSVGQVLALADGGVAVSLLHWSANLNDFRDAGVALDIGPDGRVRGRRPFEWTRGESVTAMARRGRCAGPVVGSSHGGPGRMLPIVDAEGACTRVERIDLPTVYGHTLLPCARSPVADATVVVGRRFQVELEDASEPDAGRGPVTFAGARQVTVELNDARYCLREVRAIGPYDEASPREIVLTARDGALEGSVARDGGGARAAWRRVRCEPQETP